MRFNKQMLKLNRIKTSATPSNKVQLTITLKHALQPSFWKVKKLHQALAV